MLKKAEQGFTLAESLLSLFIIMLLTALMVPLLMQMTTQPHRQWEQEQMIRILLEEGEKRLLEQKNFTSIYEGEEGETYRIIWETSAGKAEACVQNHSSAICIQEQ
ncbi:type II secretion system protein [Bacillus xiapuensis]|uniref:type II secretion system protein n=1 Tax=Bacillus xiapuensis TaxID=2014075 RepID=UPI0012FE63C6|nr:type II secretion system protein [Bacillus xiapuensis]